MEKTTTITEVEGLLALKAIQSFSECDHSNSIKSYPVSVAIDGPKAKQLLNEYSQRHPDFKFTPREDTEKGFFVAKSTFPSW
jgi:hypothetical protein